MKESSLPSNSAEFTTNLNMNSVSLVSAESRRVSFDEFSSGGAEISFSVDIDDDEPLHTKTKVNLRLFNDESKEDLYLGSSEYKLVLSSDTEMPTGPETVRQIAALALRLTFPFHRAKISAGVSEVGLPSYFLPLMSDDKWLGIVDEAEIDYGQETNESSSD